MRRILRAVIAPLFSLALYVIGNSFFATFLSVRLRTEGYSDQIVGFVGASFWLGIIIGTILTDRIIARVGHIRAFAGFAAATTALAMILCLIPSPFAWIALRIVAGFCTSGLYVVVESWLLDGSTPATRGKVLAIYMITFYAAQSLSQAILPLVPITTHLPFAIAVIFLALSVWPVSMTHSPCPAAPAPHFMNIGSLYKETPVGIWSSMIGGMMLGSFYSLVPLYVQDLNFGVSVVAEVMAITILGGLLLQWPIGTLSDRMDRRLMIAIVAVISGIVCVLLASFGGKSAAMLCVLFSLFGGFAFTLYPLGITHASDRIGPDKFVSTTASLLLCYGVGSFLGPMIAPIFTRHMGPVGLMVFETGLAFLLATYTLIRIARKRPVPQGEQVSFTSIPRTSPVVSELKPVMEERLAFQTVEGTELEGAMLDGEEPSQFPPYLHFAGEEGAEQFFVSDKTEPLSTNEPGE